MKKLQQTKAWTIMMVMQSTAEHLKNIEERFPNCQDLRKVLSDNVMILHSKQMDWIEQLDKEGKFLDSQED